MVKQRVSFDSVAEIYDETRSLPSHAMKELVKTILTQLSRYKNILDVGVGTGRFAEPLRKKGFKVVGVDIAGKMLEKAREKNVDNLLRGDVCLLPFRDDVFDASICIHLLHLVSEWKLAVSEICRVTKEVMLSVVYTSENVVGQVYNSILERYGYVSRRVGKGECELKELVEPARSVFATSYRNDFGEYLEHLSRKAYSRQWEIPEEVNRMVIEELRRRFDGTVSIAKLRVLLWDIDDLKEYCSTPE